MITLERLREVMDYEPKTGIAKWKLLPKAKVRNDHIMGSHDSKGYLQVMIDRKRYKVHRLIFFYMTGQWPKDQIDHINRNKSDNRWLNLREANNSQNQINRYVQKNNYSGIKGVRYREDTKNPWEARITKNKKLIRLGFFSTAEEASLAYKEAANKLFGEFGQ